MAARARDALSDAGPAGRRVRAGARALPRARARGRDAAARRRDQRVLDGAPHRAARARRRARRRGHHDADDVRVDGERDPAPGRDAASSSTSSRRRGSSIRPPCAPPSGRRRWASCPVHLYGQLADMRALRAIADAPRALHRRRLGPRRRDGARRRAARRPVGGRGLLVLRDEEPHVRRRRRGRDARRADRRAAAAPAQPRRQQGGDRAPRQRSTSTGTSPSSDTRRT